MKKNCPLTKEIAFTRLGKRLNEEDKNIILKTKDMVEFHFTLGMWIRNIWIYNNEETHVQALAKDLGEDNWFSPDELSSTILDGYKKHLKKLAKVTSPKK